MDLSLKRPIHDQCGGCQIQTHTYRAMTMVVVGHSGHWAILDLRFVVVVFGILIALGAGSWIQVVSSFLVEPCWTLPSTRSSARLPTETWSSQVCCVRTNHKVQAPKMTKADTSSSKSKRHKHGGAPENVLLSFDKLPHENHRREQYWWTPDTRTFILNLLRHYQHPCCLFTPSLLLDANLPPQTRILDIDDRFLSCPTENRHCFQLFDVWRPVRPPMDEGMDYDLLVLDPPFDTVKCDQLYRAIQVLLSSSRNNNDHRRPLPPMLICYPQRRASALVATFAEFGLRPLCSMNWVPPQRQQQQQQQQEEETVHNVVPHYVSVTNSATNVDDTSNGSEIYWFVSQNWDPVAIAARPLAATAEEEEEEQE